MVIRLIWLTNIRQINFVTMDQFKAWVCFSQLLLENININSVTERFVLGDCQSCQSYVDSSIDQLFELVR